MNRKILWAVLVIGAALVIAPLAMSLPSKSSAGERMMNGFEPIMRADQVETTARYYNDVFVPLGNIVPLMTEANVARFQGYAAALKSVQGPGAAQMRQDFGMLLTAMKQNTGIFSQVPAGLAHYKPLVTTMQANVDNYRQINSLPDFRLFSVFFIVPGALLVLLAGLGLFGPRVRAAIDSWQRHHPRPTPA